MKTSDYTPAAKGLHWLIALLIFVLFPLGWVMDDFTGLQKFQAFNLHKSLGLTVLVLMAAAAVAIDHDSRRARKSSRRILRPAVAVNLRRNAGNAIQAGLEQETAGAVFVITRPVARRTGEEDDSCVAG